MRPTAWLLSLLLLLAPVGLAQDGSQSSTSTSPPPEPEDPCAGLPPEEQEDCQEDLAECAEDPDDSDCREENRTGRDGPGRRPRDRPAGCEAEDRDDEERCEDAVRRIRDERGRDWISFEVDAGNATLLDYTVAGLLVLEQVRLDLDGGNLSIERHGGTLRVTDGAAELRLHDDPNGLIRFKGDNGTVTLVFPADATVAQREHGARVAYAGGREGHLLAENATWTGNATVVLHGFFAFHVPPQGAPAAEDRPADPEVEERKQEAIERRTLGAEITLKPRGAAERIAALNDSVEVLAYDDVDVQVDLPEQAAPDSPLRVVVSAELDEGRTIVLNVDGALLASTDPRDLLLRYFDLHNRTDGSVVETEVLFVQAESLQDVLQPMDDGGQPEFWVVEDANGVQVLVSVPHWSSHAITVASIATALSAPSVAVGIVVGASASIVMGALLLWPRRRDDEL